MNPVTTVSRRAFMVGSGAGSLGISFGLASAWATLDAAHAQGFGGTTSGNAFSPNGWVHFGTDGSVTLVSPAAEMGQGTMTAMPMLLAEELDLDWKQVKVVQAPAHSKIFGNPRFGGGMVTGASRTVAGYYDPIRLAGLQARLVMVQAAADMLKVPAAELRTEKSTVIHSASGRKLSYAQIAKVAQAPAELPKVDKAMLKPMSQFKIIGTDIARVDVASKSNGTAKFGIDQRMPGMLWASVLRAPLHREKLESVDDAATRALPGVKNVVRLPYGVAVVADSFHTARQGRDLLKAQWSSTSKARSHNSAAVLAEYVARSQNLSDAGVEFAKHGDTAAQLAGAVKTFSATYTSEMVSHICLEPMNCTAKVEGDQVEVWAPSQSPSFIIGALSGAAGFKPENIKINITLLGGGFGRRVEPDYALDAALVAKAMPGTPIQVIWTREDDITHDKYRPLTSQHLVAGVDAQGKLVGLLHRVVSEGIYARVAPPAFKASGGKDQPVMEGVEISYGVPGHLVQFMIEERGVDAGFWRAVGPGYTKFAIETLIDEVARGVGRDPLGYRLDMLGQHPRARAVLNQVAQMAGWGRGMPAGRALGLAFSDAWNSMIGMVAEVSIKDGKPVVHQVWAAVDPGHAVQPKNIEVQVEGSVIYGLSAALFEKITLKNGEPQETNLNSYRVLRANETPLVNVKVMPSDNHPGGMGEVGLPPIAPAVANAVAALTGKRLRSLPFTSV
ncbi:MAG: xanthine dehydrogenase family protein molybdopterin-binding subunit [Betaproteobacteria bacterium]|nr:xanthine dehydrogenase family protein molybdopterin-binding subunit [Betaproteobacteria bacterium]